MNRINRVLVWQLIATLFIGGVLYVWLGFAEAQAGLFGGFAALLLSFLLALMVRRVEKRFERNKKVNKGLLTLFFAPRLVLTLAFFALGIGTFGLKPLPMVVAFALVYLVYWIDWGSAHNQRVIL